MLYEHNKRVYDELCKSLTHSNKAIVVACTGHGKTYIAKEYLEQHHTNALVVVPRIDLMAPWEKRSEDIETITYQSFADAKNHKDYPVVILDEAHHVGAEVWGAAVRKYMQQHPDTKFIGMTADPVRYSDKCRDVSTEFFGGNIVTGYTTAEAIQAGILPSFTYVSTLIDSDAILEETSKKVHSIQHEDQELLESLTAQLQYTFQNQLKISEIIHKHMPQGKRKGILFVEKIETIEEGINLLQNNGLSPIWTVHSQKSKKQNQAAIEAFEAAEEGWLVSVNKLNEGLHVDGVNTLFFCRRTYSKTVFMQQLGRAMSAGNIDKDIVVFDFVGNHSLVATAEFKTHTHPTDSSSAAQTQPEKQQRNVDDILPDEIIVYDYASAGADILKEIAYLTNPPKWSDTEVVLLKENYPEKGLDYCATLLNKPKSAVMYKAQTLGLHHNNNWAETEIELLRENYPTKGAQYCSKILGRPISGVRGKAARLGIRYIDSKIWKKHEIDFLYENYPTKGPEYCGKELGRKPANVQDKANSLGLRYENKGKWPKEDIDFLYKNYPAKGPEYCGKKLGKKPASVKYKAGRLGIRYTGWEEKDIAFLIENYPTKGAKFCAKALGREVPNVKWKAETLHIRYNRNTWTEKDIACLTENYPTKGKKYCAKILERTENAVVLKAVQLGLHRPCNWTEKDIAILYEFYPSKGAKYCSKILGKSPDSVAAKARALGLRYSSWTEEQIQFLCENFRSKGTTYCKKILNKSDSTVRKKARELNL